MGRYIIMNASKSCHCCFTHTVMDSTKPEDYEDEDGKHYETVCECFSLEDAELVAKALNSVA